MPQHWDFGFKPSSRLEAIAQHADERGNEPFASGANLRILMRKHKQIGVQGPPDRAEVLDCVLRTAHSQ